MTEIDPRDTEIRALQQQLIATQAEVERLRAEVAHWKTEFAKLDLGWKFEHNCAERFKAEIERLRADMVKLAADMHARELAGYREREKRIERAEAEVDRLRARCAQWEREEIHRASCCMEGEEAETRLREVVEALRVMIDCSYWEHLADFERAMSPVERKALATLVAAAQPEECRCAMSSRPHTHHPEHGIIDAAAQPEEKPLEPTMKKIPRDRNRAQPDVLAAAQPEHYYACPRCGRVGAPPDHNCVVQPKEHLAECEAASRTKRSEECRHEARERQGGQVVCADCFHVIDAAQPEHDWSCSSDCECNARRAAQPEEGKS